VHGDLLAGEKGPFHLVVSNPPYVASAELDALEPELRIEPREALIGEGGHEAVARAALETLVPGGSLVLEVGDGQAGDVAARLRELGFREVRVSEDLAGRERVVEGRRP
jgi:release factor glutamine methyltransferase